MEIQIDEQKLRREIWYEAVRSRGPGGQNVNKVSSSAVLFWSPIHTQAFSLAEKDRLIRSLANKLNKENLVLIRSDEFRDLERNKARCLEKLIQVLKKALFVPKKRKPSRPTFASKVKRREQKTKHSTNKKLRSQKDWD